MRTQIFEPNQEHSSMDAFDLQAHQFLTLTGARVAIEYNGLRHDDRGNFFRTFVVTLKNPYGGLMYSLTDYNNTDLSIKELPSLWDALAVCEPCEDLYFDEYCKEYGLEAYTIDYWDEWAEIENPEALEIYNNHMRMSEILKQMFTNDELEILKEIS